MDVLPDVVFVAVGWAIFQLVFQVYRAFSGGGSGGVFGGVIVVITWLYFSGLVLLLGAVINAVFGDHSYSEFGGVGRGAKAPDMQDKVDLDTREVSAYHEDLRIDLTRESKGSGDVVRDGGYRHHPRPDGPVEVIELVNDQAEGEEWSVILRWEAAEASDAEPDLDLESRTGNRPRRSLTRVSMLLMTNE